jgi:hypothetical protein
MPDKSKKKQCEGAEIQRRGQSALASGRGIKSV